MAKILAKLHDKQTSTPGSVSMEELEGKEKEYEELKAKVEAEEKAIDDLVKKAGELKGERDRLEGLLR